MSHSGASTLTIYLMDPVYRALVKRTFRQPWWGVAKPGQMPTTRGNQPGWL